MSSRGIDDDEFKVLLSELSDSLSGYGNWICLGVASVKGDFEFPPSSLFSGSGRRILYRMLSFHFPPHFPLEPINSTVTDGQEALPQPQSVEMQTAEPLSNASTGTADRAVTIEEYKEERRRVREAEQVR